MSVFFLYLGFDPLLLLATNILRRCDLGREFDDGTLLASVFPAFAGWKTELSASARVRLGSVLHEPLSERFKPF